jgi:hypothetical protein
MCCAPMRTFRLFSKEESESADRRGSWGIPQKSVCLDNSYRVIGYRLMTNMYSQTQMVL